MHYPYVVKDKPKTFVVQFGGGISTQAALNAGSNPALTPKPAITMKNSPRATRAVPARKPASVSTPADRMAITPQCHAETYVYLAADPGLQNTTGGYWDENNRAVCSNPKSYHRETWKRLWNETERLVGRE